MSQIFVFSVLGFKKLSIRQVCIYSFLKPYGCKFCCLKFVQIGNKDNHERVHTGEKPYTCSIFNLKFKSTTGKVHHKKIHTGEKALCVQLL